MFLTGDLVSPTWIGRFVSLPLPDAHELKKIVLTSVLSNGR